MQRRWRYTRVNGHGACVFLISLKGMAKRVGRKQAGTRTASTPIDERADAGAPDLAIGKMVCTRTSTRGLCAPNPVDVHVAAGSTCVARS